MKKTIIVICLAAVLTLLLASCPSSLPEATIVNNSGYAVTFTIGKYNDITLNQTESVNIQLYGPPQVSNFEPKSVSYKVTDMTGEFTNADPIELYVSNSGTNVVELSAGGYIGTSIPGTYTANDPLPITSGAVGDTGKKIYTSSPVFTAVFIDSGVRYPATVNYDYDSTIPRIAVTVLY
jgi:hypothetical protein